MITTYRGFYWITFHNYSHAGNKYFLFNKVKKLFYIPNIWRYIKCKFNNEQYYSFYGTSVNLVKVIKRHGKGIYGDCKKSAFEFLSKNGFIIMKNICSLNDGTIYATVRYDEKSSYDTNPDVLIFYSAYTPAGEMVGEPEFALYLCNHGIVPEKADATHNICSIGFCNKEQKWYGWSHRAMYGFGIGSQVTKKCCGFVPSCKEEFIQSIKDFYDNSTYEVTDEGVVVKVIGSKLAHIERFPNKYGRGEWTALTLDEAREMAVDFANGVS